MNTSDITAIIPVKIDSTERYKNLKTVVSFLLKFYKCKIIIKEVDKTQKVFLPSNDRIVYMFEESNNEQYFHRTKILNDMLLMSDTKYTINYDCDILLPQKNCYDALCLLESGYDLVYPYQKGSFLTFWNFTDEHLNKILTDDNTFWLTYLLNKYPVTSTHSGLEIFKNLNLGTIITTGGIQIFNTKSYKNGFGENEEFIDWGPEDQERLYRFCLLGYKIGWINEGFVAHMNHPKSPMTDLKNEYNQKNHKTFEYIISNIKNKDDMVNYLNSLTYVERFKKI